VNEEAFQHQTFDSTYNIPGISPPTINEDEWDALLDFNPTQSDDCEFSHYFIFHDHESHYLTGHNIQNITQGEDPPDTNSAAPSDNSGFFTADSSESVVSHLDNGDPRMDLIQRINSLCAGGLRAGSDADGILAKVVRYVKLAESLLPQNGVNVDLNHLTWRLIQASKEGDVVEVRMLLSRDDIDANSKYIGGVTPLIEAAKNGHEAVVQSLLHRSEVNLKDNRGCTALWYAAQNGHTGIVGLLLGRRDVTPDSKDSRGRTALWLAAKNGHSSVVNLLLGRNDVDPDTNVDGDTPLMVAADNGHEEVVRLLLGKDNVDPNREKRGETPLFRAAANGHSTIVQLLLQRDGVDLNQPSNDTGWTPLMRAAGRGMRRWSGCF
jgi:ankyrin repeat protein